MFFYQTGKNICTVKLLGMETENFTFIEISNSTPNSKLIWADKKDIFTYSNTNQRFFHLFTQPNKLKKLNEKVNLILNSQSYRDYVQNSMKSGNNLTSYDILAMRVVEGIEEQIRMNRKLGK